MAVPSRRLSSLHPPRAEASPLRSLFRPGGASAGTVLNLHARSRARMRRPSQASSTQATPPRPCFAAHGHVKSSPRVCYPSPGIPALLAYLNIILCTCSPSCWCTHLDVVGNPSLVVVVSVSAAAPAMASSPRRRNPFSRPHLSCPSEQVGPHGSRHGMC